MEGGYVWIRDNFLCAVVTTTDRKACEAITFFKDYAAELFVSGYAIITQVSFINRRMNILKIKYMDIVRKASYGACDKPALRC